MDNKEMAPALESKDEELEDALVRF